MILTVCNVNHRGHLTSRDLIQSGRRKRAAGNSRGHCCHLLAAANTTQLRLDHVSIAENS